MSVSNVRSLAFRSDAAMLTAAADQVRGQGRDASDLAELLDELARVLRSAGRPALGETEMWRWAGIVGRACRIARERVRPQIDD